MTHLPAPSPPPWHGNLVSCATTRNQMRFIAFRLQIVLDLHCLACDFAQHFSIFKYLLCAGRGTHRASHAPRREKAAGLSQESAAAVARAKQVLASPLVHCARKPANTNDRKQPRVGYTVSRTAGACECVISQRIHALRLAGS